MFSSLRPRSILWLSGKRSYYGFSRTGNRDIVGHGCNGTYSYKDDSHFPFPAIRFRETDCDICRLRGKEMCDWRLLSCQEKKALYRASFCQTFAEFKHPTGGWKFCLGWAFLVSGFAFWLMIFAHTFVNNEELPESLCEENQAAQLRRMLELRVNPIDGISSKWDYDNDTWK